MKKREPRVPRPPTERLAIPQEDLRRLTSWMNFFRNLSPRLKVVPASEEGFENLLSALEQEVRVRRLIEPEYQLVGWPKSDNVAFVVTIDSHPPGSPFEDCKIEDKHIFCFDNVAFGANYFEWDGDSDEECAGPATYSLSGYSEDSLYWEYVRTLIVDKVTDLEQRVPAIKT